MNYEDATLIKKKYRAHLKSGAQMGHSRSFSPRERRLKEWPHRKCATGSSSG